MKYFDWDEMKNSLLKAERDICFEDVLIAIEQENILDTLVHPDQKRYPSQKLLIVKINNYAYAVPFVEDDVRVFLKTIIPSRKYTRKYLKGDKS